MNNVLESWKLLVWILEVIKENPTERRGRVGSRLKMGNFVQIKMRRFELTRNTFLKIYENIL